MLLVDCMERTEARVSYRCQCQRDMVETERGDCIDKEIGGSHKSDNSDI